MRDGLERVGHDELELRMTDRQHRTGRESNHLLGDAAEQQGDMPVRPCVPMMIRSMWASFAYVMIACAGIVDVS